MITIKPAADPISSNHKFGLALAGGGPLGGFYELGALCALEDHIEDVSMNDLDMYVGVSSGAFLAAGLANGISLRQMVQIFIFDNQSLTPFNPDHFLQPAYRDYIVNLAKSPKLLTKTLLEWAKNPMKMGIVDLLENLGTALPTGVFNNKKLEQFLQSILIKHGKSNDFRELDKQLYIVACELNTGKIAGFGNGVNEDVPISKAVQASSALPGLYAPVNINGKYYVDGALRRTMNASAALKQDTQLLFAVNPIVPFSRAPESTKKGLESGGLPMVLSQTFRSIVQSRLKSGLDKYESLYPTADIVLAEPDADDERLFNSNLFSYSHRDELCDYAYQVTRKHLQQQQQELIPILNRHGLHFDSHKLNAKHRCLQDYITNSQPTYSWRERLDDSLSQLEQSLKTG
ncbi:patatin-like phospholipase family protein [Marinicella gelatinilytica]|uniref:patatin-like phospholipase family protein n=1 Tax=Marinicella gelatinilytica TaxID=2996017 RepID=UPI002260D5FB|nr:patatin-like phospholipase family protein [Marinicella gelatinilytica]MCX7544294.1 patatin-like phospholipase family protein [Marinicella gelatinilytica]